MKSSVLVTLTAAALLAAAPLSAKPAKTRVESNRCSYEHYPVAVGIVSEYRTTSKHLDAAGKVVNESSNSYTEEVVSVEATSYRTKNGSAGNSSESTWLCGDEGISLKYDEYPETKITASGVSVPPTMEVGGSWTHTFTMESPAVTQTTKSVNRVTKREMVSVPAGSFEAWRVEWDSETIVAGTDAPTVLHGVSWYATSVGLVKSSITIPMEMEDVRSIETVTELMKQSTQ
jgi:hypothetical protein